MSRIAEASARAGRAVPDNPRVDWAKEREAAERLLRDTVSEQAPRPSAPTVTSSRSPVRPVGVGARHDVDVGVSVGHEVVEQTFAWPPQFDLDAIDLSRDSNARNFRRPSARRQAPPDERGVEVVDDETPPHRPRLRYESGPPSYPPPVTVPSIPPRATAASASGATGHEYTRAEARGTGHEYTRAETRGTGRERTRAEAGRGTLRWVVVAVALVVLLASAALLTYWLWNRQVATGQQNVPALANSAPAVAFYSSWNAIDAAGGAKRIAPAIDRPVTSNRSGSDTSRGR